MNDPQKAAAMEKVAAKACTWADCRRVKAAATGEQRERAQYRFKKAGDELAEAVEKLQKYP